ncbi:folylpolyglutamate synthase, mitochondrial isoform X1 [Glossina fuscipes]|uniref:tetrahydrofolate synthase n=2 Tax=Glossina fuscipes TaxID=7396 RepID=A0A9C6DRH3_9MUSC|nr:folylpolyglutamate synthase, mitochondrial isoform X1 [Glossina fuscipes]
MLASLEVRFTLSFPGLEIGLMLKRHLKIKENLANMFSLYVRRVVYGGHEFSPLLTLQYQRGYSPRKLFKMLNIYFLYHPRQLKMFQTFEECVFQSTQKRPCSTLIEKSNKQIILQRTPNKYKSNEQKYVQYTEDQKYGEAIETLNALQTNAEALRLSMKHNINHLEDTHKYLLRSGLTLFDLKELSYIHVSGTKGKGSTCALTESILYAYGLKTGFYSSPHLVSVTERIRVNGEPISKEKFTRYFWKIYDKLQDAQDYEHDMPGYFKFLTILAFHVFLEERVDVVILEVGIGGELDCTNIVPNTKTVGITSLGLEHTNLLGETLNEIAWQKAGIIKPGSMVYTTVAQEDCIRIIRDRCKEKGGADLHKVPDFELYFQDEKDRELKKSLNHVILLNGSLAIQLAYDWLRQNRKDMTERKEINKAYLTKQVVEGLINCHWPGRCQMIKYLNLNMYLDGAHTSESMKICGSWFSQSVSYSENPKILIFNITGDRDSTTLLKILKSFSVFDLVCFLPNVITSATTNTPDTQLIHAHREQLERAKMHACNWELLCLEDQTPNFAKVFPSLLSCFQYIQDEFDKSQQLDVLVTGSLHLLGATILSLNKLYKNI